MADFNVVQWFQDLPTWGKAAVIAGAGGVVLLVWRPWAKPSSTQTSDMALPMVASGAPSGSGASTPDTSGYQQLAASFGQALGDIGTQIGNIEQGLTQQLQASNQAFAQQLQQIQQQSQQQMSAFQQTLTQQQQMFAQQQQQFSQQLAGLQQQYSSQLAQLESEVTQNLYRNNYTPTVPSTRTAAPTVPAYSQPVTVNWTQSMQGSDLVIRGTSPVTNSSITIKNFANLTPAQQQAALRAVS